MNQNVENGWFGFGVIRITKGHWK